MNTLESLNTVIDYIEKHITEELDLNHLAGIACRSLYDFQRMFMFIAEMSIVEYIRKRRLTLAGLDLKHNGAKVIDAALKYGYESPVSFTRAFQAFHGIVPSKAKKSNVSLKIFPRLIFQIIVKEVAQMIRTEKIIVTDKEYEALYFGEQDMTWTGEYTKCEYWRLENAYDDFKNKPRTGIIKPCNNYPMNIESEQVFVLDFTKNDSAVDRFYYIFDGTIWQDMPVTSQLRVEPTPVIKVDRIEISGKEYDASYFGEQDMSWSKEYAKCRYWRLENAYGDFKNKPKTGMVKPYNNYPMDIELEQIFVIDFIKKDCSVNRHYYIADGAVWQNYEATSEFSI